MVVLNILLIILAVIFGLFILTFTIYMFNLDMKFAAKLIPFMNKHYDKIKRERHL